MRRLARGAVGASGVRPSPDARPATGSPFTRAPSRERMNSPLELRKVPLRGLHLRGRALQSAKADFVFFQRRIHSLLDRGPSLLDRGPSRRMRTSRECAPSRGCRPSARTADLAQDAELRTPCRTSRGSTPGPSHTPRVGAAPCGCPCLRPHRTLTHPHPCPTAGSSRRPARAATRGCPYPCLVAIRGRPRVAGAGASKRTRCSYAL